MPFKLLLSGDPLVREVIPADDLQQHLNMSYLHGEVTSRVSHSLLTSLGVQVLTTNHLLEFARMTVLRNDVHHRNPGQFLSKVALNCFVVFRFKILLNYVLDSLFQVTRVELSSLASGWRVCTAVSTNCSQTRIFLNKCDNFRSFLSPAQAQWHSRSVLCSFRLLRNEKARRKLEAVRLKVEPIKNIRKMIVFL